ncbi:Os01g0884700 [Oryza sativa Japonica Group]|uniref:Os01g0884700 protein n=2 Tax=Oryza sativa subsp. japonica TaxID=39947 RepID=A0A0P0VBA4_ORYSJ|nr:hypothetical protein EE612_007225 [Oryza sativa]BAS75591.1 Os01g0884700 [Oryza sativa Japonica Group]
MVLKKKRIRFFLPLPPKTLESKYPLQTRESSLRFPTQHGTTQRSPPQIRPPRRPPPPPLASPEPRLEMDGEAADLNDWELLLTSPTAADEAAAAETRDGGGDDEAGAIKYDYFELGSDVKYPERVSFSKELEEEGEGEEEEGVASGNASWVEPDPDDLVFPGPDRAALWSDSSDDGERREEAEATEPLPVEAAAAEVEAGEGAVTKGGGAGAGVVRWWHLPMGVLRAWALRAARSVWSLPVAVALLGIAVLGRRLYRMRRQSKAVARVRLVLDEKVRPLAAFPAMPLPWVKHSNLAPLCLCKRLILFVSSCIIHMLLENATNIFNIFL